jgi:hypothetical protein
LKFESLANYSSSNLNGASLIYKLKMICEYCKNEHDGSFQTGRFCNISCKNKYGIIKSKNKKIWCNVCQKYIPKLGSKQHFQKHENEAKKQKISYNCENCGKYVVGLYGSGRFCSAHCARSYSTKEKRIEINEKVGNKLKKPKIIYNKICLCCKNSFETFYKNQKCCSLSCSSKYKWKNVEYREKVSNKIKGSHYKFIKSKKRKIENNENGFIYMITNLKNGKIYIGKTIYSIEERFKSHLKIAKYKKKKWRLHNAINKYGPENFKIELIWEGYLRYLDEMEIFFIKELNTMDKDKGYNMTEGGEGTLGHNK